MPDIDTLMQAWPEAVEEVLAKIQLPSAELDVPLDQYVDIVCGALRFLLKIAFTMAQHYLIFPFKKVESKRCICSCPSLLNLEIRRFDRDILGI